MENFSEQSSEELADFVTRRAGELALAAAELARRHRGPSHESDVPQPLIGPDEACALLGMHKRALYRLEKEGRLPFAKSRNQKDRCYDRAGLLKWRDRQVSKAA